MKSYVIISVLALISLCSCNSCNQSDWDEIIIPSDESLVFMSMDKNDPYYSKAIIIPMDENFTDTLFVFNRNQVAKVCYFKLTNPNNDIRLEYIKEAKEVRFIYLVE